MQGVERLTVVVKATFRLVHEAYAELSSPLEIHRADLPPDSRGSLVEACEIAPYLPSAGVLVRGHACAPAGQPTTALTVRLALYRDGRWTLDKVLHAFGDRSREAPSPRPFQRIPLVYERAYGGEHIDANPVGVGAGMALPNLLDPVDASRPAGLGPVARQWAPRRSLLGGAEEPSSFAPELDARFDFRYYNAAPRDQQIDFLRVDEWILLQGMHAQLPWVRSKLPSARGVARLRRAGGIGQENEQAVELVADTLTIDADRLICSVVWRGSIALQPGDTPDRLYVLAGVELPGLPLRWPAVGALRSASAQTAATAPRRPGTTLDLRDAAVAGHLERPIAPFALAPPDASSAQSNPIPGAPWSTEQDLPSMWLLDPEEVDATCSIVLPPRGPASGAVDPSATSLAETALHPGERGPAPAGSAAPRAPAAPPPPGLAGAGRSEPKPEASAPEATGIRATVLARRRDGEPLHDLKLSHVHLDEIDFSGASLERWNFAGSSLVRCRFDKARLAGANLRGADLTEATFSGADLTAADLSGARFDGARLDGALLARADLAGTKGSNASFEGASLEGADLRQARLPGAGFDRANLTSSLASRADLSGASFIGANLTGVILRATKLRGATLAGTTLTGADLRDADLTGATLHAVDLVSARTAGAILRDVVERAPPGGDEDVLSGGLAAASRGGGGPGTAPERA
ncbi:uncharacterized protein SOCEGT47_062970 [Sorangium cellulosum]|uniref:DUF2169 domain-containing protein n=2 Tax=Sorangium cellulosum TaxID=56 RepID=A0A4P2Q953_SORCE|nr:uncharacterized protein SOCEGT47_062970 [Sorangium cellulosum]